MGPFALKGLNEPLGLAVYARGEGAGADVANVAGGESLAEQRRAVARTSVGHHPFDAVAAGDEPVQRASEKGGRALLLLVGRRLDTGQP